ncbi:MAG: AAA family ATPase [Burkholderiales bacterium]
MASFTSWLHQNNLEQYAPAFLENEVDFSVVRRLTDADLKELGLTLGARKRFLEAVEKLGTQALAQPGEASAPQGAERRQLTILFCDLVGSTALSRQLDPERLRELMQAYQQTCRGVIEKYEGHVAQYLGDGLMVYFGWPRAHEDDAERAVRAALELIDVVKSVPAPLALQVRIGIATGPVVVGETGSGDASVPKLAVGETPNLAARLQGLAGPDEIIVAPSTHRLVGGAFTYAGLGSQVLKGIVEAVQPFRVTGRGKSEGRFDAAHGHAALTPLVGRESELALIKERWAQASEGEGQLILLSGEPGIGKSRVTQALRQRIEEQAHHRRHYQCSPYHTQSALYPIAELLERIAGFAREDSPEVKLDKLEALLRPGGQDLALVVPLFAALLSLPAGKYPALNFSPQKQKEKLLEAWVEQIGGLAKTQPVLMVFEDAHWVDPTTQEALDLLVARIARWRVMLLITHRTEYTPRWSGEPHVTAITLNRFNPRLGALMAEKVTGGKPLPAQVIEQIVAKTDGVPLFVEELTKHVLESGFLKDTGTRYELDGPLPPLAIPSTLHDSLMARLDRLAPVKEVAQTGACIGREFSYELLAAISPMSERSLDEALKQLVLSQLVFQHGTPPQATYTFKHALVQDAAYGSLLKSRRQVLHKNIAETLEQRFPERVANEPEVVAHHYTEAGLNEQATDFWLKAGQRGIERFANAEAIAHLNRGLKTLEALPAGKERDQRELLLQINLGNALGASKGYTPPEVGRAFGRARDLCENAGNIPEMLSILTGLSVYYMMRAEYRESVAVDEQIFALAKQIGSSGGLLTAHSRRGFTAVFTGDFSDSLAHGEAGLVAYDRSLHANLALLYGYDMGIACLDFTAWSLLASGLPDQSAKRHAIALDYATQLGHPLTFAMVVVHVACLDCLREDHQATLDHARNVIAYCKENSILIRQIEGEILEGWALSELGDTARGIPQLEAGIQVWLQLGAQIANPLWYSCLARAYAKAGRMTDARVALKQALDATNNHGERLMEAELYRIEGDLWLASYGSEAQAEASYRQAIEVATELKAKLWELRAAIALARLWHSQGKRSEAIALLKPVYEWFTEGFDTKDLKDARSLIAELSP